MSHYFTNDQGRMIPSVTTVLKILNKDGIAEWANYLGFKGKGYKKTLNELALVGTEVHKLVEEFLKEKEFKSKIIPTLVDDIYPYLESFAKWYKETRPNIEVIESEKTYISNIYGGTIDLLCKVDGRYTLIDIKTSKKLYPTHYIQLAGYLGLIYMKNEEIFNKIDRVGVLLVNKKKTTLNLFPVDKIYDYMTLFKLLLVIYYKYDDILKDSWGTTLMKGDDI